ncbi:MAG: M14 family metallopeptidase [Elusimicrobiota bacterium]
MKRVLISLALTNLLTFAVSAGETSGPVNVSFDQLLSRITSVPADTPAAPGPVSDKAAFAGQAGDRYWITVKAADKYARTRLLEAGMDIVEVNGGKSSGFAGPHTMDLLSSGAFVVESKMTIAQYDAVRNRNLTDFPVPDAAYHNFMETTGLLRQMADANPEIASLFSIGKTSEGRDIWCLRINSDAKGEAASSKPGALYIGNHHAREHLSNEVPLLFAAWLFDHKNDADIKEYINNLDIYIVPMLNPDGAEYDIKTGSYRYHRKNMRVNPDKSIGVDLNRNYDSWFCEAGASTYPGSDTYCGPRAFSEPESQAVKKLIEGRKNLKTHISYHSYGSVILYPWGGQEADIADVKDRQAFIGMAAAMGRLTGYSPEKSSDLYVATGDSCDWAYAAAGIFAFTFELEGGGFYPGAAVITRAVTSNIKAAVYMLSVTDNPYKAI